MISLAVPKTAKVIVTVTRFEKLNAIVNVQMQYQQKFSEIMANLMRIETKVCDDLLRRLRAYVLCVCAVRICLFMWVCLCVSSVRWEDLAVSGEVDRRRRRGVFWDKGNGNAGDGSPWVVVEIAVVVRATSLGHTRWISMHGFYHRQSIDTYKV